MYGRELEYVLHEGPDAVGDQSLELLWSSGKPVEPSTPPPSLSTLHHHCPQYYPVVLGAALKNPCGEKAHPSC